jgi:putative inorganic carbon (HCO3(-)) transporter
MKTLTVCNSILLIGLFIYALSAATSTSGIAIGVNLALLAWIVRMLLTKQLETRGVVLNLPILVLLVILMIAAIASPSIPFIQGFGRIRSIVGGILLYYLVFNGIRNEQNIKWLLACLIVGLSLLSVYETAWLMWNPTPEKQAAMMSNKTLGGCLGMVIPLVVSMAFPGSFSFKIRIGLIVSLVSMVICLNLNSSRGAWLGNICAMVFLGVMMNKKVLLVLCLAIIISLLFLPEKQMYRIKNMFNLQYRANAERVYLWQGALAMIKERPFIGHGPGSFQTLYPKYVPVISEETKKGFYPAHGHRHAHNIFIHLAAEAGIFAFLTIIWLLGASFRWTWQVFKHTGTNWLKILALGIMACLIDFSIHGMVDYTLTGMTGYLFWFYLGIISWIGKFHKCGCYKQP